MSHTHAQPSESAATPKSWQMPDTLILIFIVGILAAILTYLIPAGHFDSQQVAYMVDGAEKLAQLSIHLLSLMQPTKTVNWFTTRLDCSLQAVALV